MQQNSKAPVVLALGYFDSVHTGHRQVIGEASALAKQLHARLVVFTFSGNLRGALSGEDDKCIYTLSEREKIFDDLGVDELFVKPASAKFLSMGKLAFLNLLNKNYNVLSYVCGEDYRFGKGGAGDVEYLKRYAARHSQTVSVKKLVKVCGQKASTTAVKALLKEGKIKKANEMLGRPYSVSGVVFEDRKVGSKMGFPTVNIGLQEDKFRIKDGVYAGHIYLNVNLEKPSLVRYRALINYGARPTFNLHGKLVEAHIVDYDGDLYGKEITIYFDSFARDIIKFDSAEALQNQLNCDLSKIKDGFYD